MFGSILKKYIIAVFHVQIVEVCVWYKVIFNEYFCYTYTQKYSCNIISLNTTFFFFAKYVIKIMMADLMDRNHVLRD